MATTNAYQVLYRAYLALNKSALIRFLPWLLLTISLLVTLLLWNSAQSENKQLLQTEFDYSVGDAKSRIMQQMVTYEHLLRGVHGLFVGLDTVQRSEFRTYVDSLNIKKNYPSIKGLGYSLLIPATRIKSHFAVMQRQGFSHYSIFPSGVRDRYTSVIFMEPFSGKNIDLLGHDFLADPEQKTAMEGSRDTGTFTITSTLRRAPSDPTKAQAGLMMWLAVYKNGAPHTTQSERQTNIMGWVFSSLRMDDLMSQIYDLHEPKLDIEIYDGSNMSDMSLIHDRDKIRHNKSAAASSFQNISALNIAGHKWILVLSSLPDFDQRQDRRKPQIVALTGIFISILLTVITSFLVSSQKIAMQTAQTLNRELIERKRAEASMRLASQVIETVDMAVLVTDEHTNILQVNPAFTAITGYSQNDALGRTPNMLSSGSHPPEFYKIMWDSLSKNGSWQGEIFNRRKNGEFYTEWLSINEVRDEEGKVTNYIALFSDITERKAEEDHMHALAHYDPLTGLPNRTLLSDRLQQAITAAKREKSHMALMFIDLDKFKPVNDTLGHQVGDLMLKEVARRMLHCLRESDTAARIGGDEFVVLLPLMEMESDATSVAEKIREAIYQPFELAEQVLQISTCIGIAVYPEHGVDEKSLLKNADTAMYYAKKAGRNNVMLFNSSFMHPAQ